MRRHQYQKFHLKEFDKLKAAGTIKPKAVTKTGDGKVTGGGGGLSEEEKKEIERVFGIKTKTDWDNLLKLVQQAQEEFGREKSTKLTFWRPKQDLKGEKTGYKGRMGIYEVLKNTATIQNLIVSNGTSDEIQNKAIEEGMLTMQLDGLVKAMLGMTSIEEILRVTRE